MLGGWSLRGMHAYEAARQLVLQGEEITGLILIDSPCPRAIPGMPEPAVEFWETIGMFMGTKREGAWKDK